MDFLWLSDVDPVWAIAMVIAAYAGLLVWVVRQPAAAFTAGAPDQRRWRDLRWWIVPVLLVQIWLHWLFR